MPGTQVGQAGLDGQKWVTITIVPSHKACLCLTVRNAMPGKLNLCLMKNMVSYFLNILFVWMKHHFCVPLLAINFKLNKINKSNWHFWYTRCNCNPITHNHSSLYIQKPMAITVRSKCDSVLSAGYHDCWNGRRKSFLKGVLKMTIVNKRKGFWKNYWFQWCSTRSYISSSLGTSHGLHWAASHLSSNIFCNHWANCYTRSLQRVFFFGMYLPFNDWQGFYVVYC